MEDELDLSLGLSLGGLFGIDKTKRDKLPWSSSAAAVPTPPVEVPAPAPPALPRASGSPSSTSVERDGQRLQGTAFTEESSSSSVPSFGPSLAPRTIADNTGDDVGRWLMKEMPSVHTNDLRNGKEVNGFLYKYRKGDDVTIVCICHGNFFTPSEFVEHAGGSKVEVDKALRHIKIVVSPTL